MLQDTEAKLFDLSTAPVDPTVAIDVKHIPKVQLVPTHTSQIILQELRLGPRDAIAKAGAMIPVTLRIPRSMVAAGHPDRPEINGLALIDTGSTTSAVSYQAVSQHLGLQSNGAVNGGGSTGLAEHQTFPVEIVFDVGLPILSIKHAPAFQLQNCIALLGRDFLQDKVLIFNGRDGMFTLCW